MSFYRERIAEIVPYADPRHVEAFMRLEYGTLDHLSPEGFAREARLSAACVSECGPGEAEALAVSYGL